MHKMGDNEFVTACSTVSVMILLNSVVKMDVRAYNICGNLPAVLITVDAASYPTSLNLPVYAVFRSGSLSVVVFVVLIWLTLKLIDVITLSPAIISHNRMFRISS